MLPKLCELVMSALCAGSTDGPPAHSTPLSPGLLQRMQVLTVSLCACDTMHKITDGPTVYPVSSETLHASRSMCRSTCCSRVSMALPC